MVVQNYDVQTSSQHTYLSVKSTSMLASKNLDASNIGRWQTASQEALAEEEDLLDLSGKKEKKPNNGLALGHLKQQEKQIKDDSIKYLAANSNRAWGPHKAHSPYFGTGGKTPSNPAELKLRLIEMMFEMLTKSSKSSLAKSFTSDSGSLNVNSQSESFDFAMSFFGSFFGVSEAPGAAREGWKVESFEYESEQVSYQAQGIVNTADCRSINVDINMYMSRQFVSYMNMDVEVTQRLCDPLVINYAGTAASLTGETFSFDLTSDGNMESLASLGAGSGFLALDKNGDGSINDGTELFGPNSGCGFTELREHDFDGNGWIDEADDVFDKLVVWARDKDGNETSYSLKELGIGAIFLGDIATEFSFKDESNQTLGVMRSTSFFLKEDGGAGTVSHVDLSV